MSRDKSLALAFGVLAVLAVVGVGARVFLGPGPNVATVAAQAERDGDQSATITFVGDTLLGDQAQRLLQKKGYDWPFGRTQELLDSDFTIANAETPITRRTQWGNPTADYSYRSLPPAAHSLARAGVDALGLANNHAMDRGPEGLADTLRYAQAAGMATFGAGVTPEDAAAPLMVETDAGTVAVIGFGEDFGSLSRVSDQRPGMAVMRQDRIRSAYFSARAAGADHVVAFLHWGDNYQPVNRQQRGWAQVFADTGYDLVVGTGPHVVQPIRLVGGMPVVYSLGNYAFGTPGRWATYDAQGYGIVATLELTTDGATLRAHCIVTDNARARYQPFQCPAPEARTVLMSLSPDITVARGVGTLPLPGFTHTG